MKNGSDFKNKAPIGELEILYFIAYLIKVDILYQ